jgi:hypothetical protein
MSKSELIIILISGIIIGMVLYGLVLNYLNYSIYQPDYVESLKLCVYSHNWNSSFCLYHKPF